MAAADSITLPAGSMLTVLREESRRNPRSGRSFRFLFCQCKCGITKWILKSSVVDGGTLSCGCLWKKSITKHGMGNSRAYSCWENMRDRCFNKKNKRYASYGGRGITVCREWDDFRVYYAHLLTIFPAGVVDVPPNMTIDRIDNSKGYEPGNIRIATAKTQQRNIRSNRLVTINGRTLCVSEWAEKLGIDRSMVFARISRGYSPEDAITIPPKFRRKRAATAA